jgi:putative peptide modification system cyclase
MPKTRVARMSEIQPDTPSAAGPAKPESVLRAIAVCDLVNSTALIEQLGDRKGAEFMQQLDRFARDLLKRHNGREIDKTDGFLLLFDRPIQAVAFAIDYQRLLRELGEMEFLPLKARIGLHVGDVVLWENQREDIERGAKRVEVEGLAKPVAARLMHLALPGQILVSGIAQSLVARAHAELDVTGVVWVEHGRYRFKGVAEPVNVFEVGEPTIAPLTAPVQNGKAHRDIPWWRRRTTLAVEAAVLVAAVTGVAYVSVRSPDAIAFSKRDWIVVGDLVNQTGESILNDSLQTAFRIGLEQSRYVNVISDLKVRSTLGLMQRDPEKTHVDRAVGSEVAIRDGARVLVLPSVSEIGGRVRVTAEVVDPRTQSTVYSEAAEGVGFSSVLPSLDKLGQQLRVRLGETHGSVEASAPPLPQVTTANLDALRAYALGLQANAESHEADAVELFKHAIKLDPDFALAYMGLARVYKGNDDDATSYAYVQKALSLKERLPPRDQLYLDAWSAEFGPPGPMLDKWRLLAKLYPDYYAASYNYAFFAWQLENRTAEAIDAMQPALSVYDPLRGVAYYTLAYIQTADNRFVDAGKNFDTALSITAGQLGGFYVAHLAAQRRYDEAATALTKVKTNGIDTEDVFDPLIHMQIHVDRGDVSAARALALKQLPAAAKVGPLYERAFHAIVVTMNELAALAVAEKIAAIRPLVTELRTIVAKPATTNHQDDIFALLLGAYFAARAGDVALAQSALDGAMPYARDSGYVNTENMFAVATTEIACRSGDCKDAIGRLEALRNGTELYLTHLALADAYATVDRKNDALAEARWLAEHRGRAYLEINSFRILDTYYVAQSNLALLRCAELEHALHEDDAAKKDAAAFDAAWPVATRTTDVASRAAKLSADLNPRA